MAAEANQYDAELISTKSEIAELQRMISRLKNEIDVVTAQVSWRIALDVKWKVTTYSRKQKQNSFSPSELSAQHDNKNTHNLNFIFTLKSWLLLTSDENS